MKPALVIGNGTSRLNFNLRQLERDYVTYGCNALYRDYIPNVLVSMDIHMVTEILNSRVHHKCKFYTQHLNDIDLLAGNGEPINFVKTYIATPDSGTAAVELASKNHNTVYIIGFDYHNGQHNNVYAGTANYNAKQYSTPIVQDEKWRSRLANIAKEYSHINYIRVSDDNTTYHVNNLRNISIKQFKEIYDVRI